MSEVNLEFLNKELERSVNLLSSSGFQDKAPKHLWEKELVKYVRLNERFMILLEEAIVGKSANKIVKEDPISLNKLGIKKVNSGLLEDPWLIEQERKEKENHLIAKARYEVLKKLREEIPKLYLRNHYSCCVICFTKFSPEKMIKEPLSYRVVMDLSEESLLSDSYIVICWPCWFKV